MKIQVTRGYEYRIYPTKEQQQLINKTVGCCRFVYNHFLALRHDEFKFNGKKVTLHDTITMLPDLKKREEYKWLREVDSVALQQSLRNLDDAYQRFFKKQNRYPKFHSKKNYTQKYRTQMIVDPQGHRNIEVIGNYVKLPKLGLVKIKLHRNFEDKEAKILNATITRHASGKYFVSLCVKETVEMQSNLDGHIGLDVGLKAYLTDSFGKSIENPRWFKAMQKKLAREQRRLSRKMPKSNRREKQRVKTARVHAKIVNKRKDFQHKLAYHLCLENSVIVVEKLKIKNMTKNRRLSKAISDASWGRFFKMLKYKAPLFGGQLIKVPTFYPSSQTCSCCGYKNPITKDLGVREWICPQCHTYHDRDANAAKNILKKGLEMLK